MAKKILSLTAVLVMSFVLMTGCFFRCSENPPDDPDDPPTFLSLEDIRERLADAGHLYGIDFFDDFPTITSDTAFGGLSNVRTMSSGNTRQPPNFRIAGHGFGISDADMIIDRNMAWAEIFEMQQFVVNRIETDDKIMYILDGDDWWYEVGDEIDDWIAVSIPQAIFAALNPGYFRTNGQLSNNAQRVWELNQNGRNNLIGEEPLTNLFRGIFNCDSWDCGCFIDFDGLSLAEMVEDITVTIFPNDTVKILVHWIGAMENVLCDDNRIDFTLTLGGQSIEPPANALPCLYPATCDCIFCILYRS